MSFRFVPTQREIENFKQIAKKLKKIQKYHYGIISSQNSLEKAIKERKKKLSFRSVPTRHVIENSKKIAKKFKKIKKYSYVFFSRQNRFDKEGKGRK